MSNKLLNYGSCLINLEADAIMGHLKWTKLKHHFIGWCLFQERKSLFKDKMFCYPQITNQRDLWQSEIINWDYHHWQPSEEKSDNTTVNLFMLRQLTNKSMIPELSRLASSQTCLKTPPLFPLPQLLTWLASLQAGLEIISRLAPVKLSGQTYFCSDTPRFWPEKCLSSRIIWLHFTVKYMRTHALLNLRWRLYGGQSNKFLTRNSLKMKNHCRAVLQKFHVVAEPWNSGKSVKFGRNFTKYMSVQHIWDFFWLMGCFCHKLANSSWNLITAARKCLKSYNQGLLDYYRKNWALASAW